MSAGFENTAPRRTEPARRRDFVGLKGDLSLRFNFHSHQFSKDAVAAWNNHIPLSPRTAYEILTRDLPAGTRVSFTEMDDHGGGNLTLENLSDAGDGRETFSNDREFNLSRHEVYQGTVRVHSAQQSRHIGRHSMRNQIEFFHACGVREFNILAGSKNGGYTWARLGFLPAEFDGDFCASMRRAVNKDMDILRPILDPATRTRIDRSLRFRRRTDLWRIADTDTDLVPVLSGVFNRASADAAPADIALRDTLRLRYGDAFDRAVSSGRPLPLGRVLLTGTSWDGILDMNDKRQMRRVGAYCGGWKYINVS